VSFGRSQCPGTSSTQNFSVTEYSIDLSRTKEKVKSNAIFSPLFSFFSGEVEELHANQTQIQGRND
jgi:hypothetical protein